MKPIPPKQIEPPTRNSYRVEFYPSVEDYVYIASRIAKSGPAMTDARYVHYAFLVLNSVFFPAFLFLSDYFIAGLIVFAANLLALMFLFPRINLASYRQYYRRIFGNRENEIATVDLTEAGIVYSSDESEASFPWRRITSIEETPDAIYFFFAGNGFAVRKSGFAYEDEQKSFYDYARGRLSSVHAQQIEA